MVKAKNKYTKEFSNYSKTNPENLEIDINQDDVINNVAENYMELCNVILNFSINATGGNTPLMMAVFNELSFRIDKLRGNTRLDSNK